MDDNSPLNLKIKAKKPRREETYELLKKAIIKGDIEPGVQLIETDLAQRLGVGRTTVREAIRKLKSEGLIETHPEKGLIVNEFTYKDIEEIQGIRMVLERYAARLAAERVKDEELIQIEDVLDQSKESLQRGDMDKVLKLNTRFHNLINSISGSSRLQGMIYELHESILNYQRAALNTVGYAEQALKEHRMILDALKMRNPDMAEVMASQHVSEKKKVVLRWVEE
jgi:DNA-binding GntR family transcriptional regulator